MEQILARCEHSSIAAQVLLSFCTTASGTMFFSPFYVKANSRPSWEIKLSSFHCGQPLYASPSATAVSQFMQSLPLSFQHRDADTDTHTHTELNQTHVILIHSAALQLMSKLQRGAKKDEACQGDDSYVCVSWRGRE